VNVTFSENGTAAGHGGQALGPQTLARGGLYKPCAQTWSDFCRSHLKISSEADRTIHLLDAFGADYFDPSALTRISPETYRAIAPVVKDGALHFNGEANPLKPRELPQGDGCRGRGARSIQSLGRDVRIYDRIVELDKLAIAAEFEEIARGEALLECRLRFKPGTLESARQADAGFTREVASIDAGQAFPP
jgi:hypothetical protein